MKLKKLLIVAICVFMALVTLGCGETVEVDDTVIDYDDLPAVDEEKLAAGLKELGYETLEAYREENHDYRNYDGNEDITFGEMEGYWYPNGDRNSLFYIEIDELGMVRFWQFNYSEDELVGDTAISTMAFDTYTFSNGQKCEIKNYNLVFEDYDTTFTRFDF